MLRNFLSLRKFFILLALIFLILLVFNFANQFGNKDSKIISN